MLPDQNRWEQRAQFSSSHPCRNPRRRPSVCATFSRRSAEKEKSRLSLCSMVREIIYNMCVINYLQRFVHSAGAYYCQRNSWHDTCRGLRRLGSGSRRADMTRKYAVIRGTAIGDKPMITKTLKRTLKRTNRGSLEAEAGGRPTPPGSRRSPPAWPRHAIDP